MFFVYIQAFKLLCLKANNTEYKRETHRKMRRERKKEQERERIALSMTDK
jgi:hypothetical protein